MADNTKSVLCGACRVAVEGPTDPNPQDTFSCPQCGKADSFENVMASVQSFITEAASHQLQESMRKAARGNKAIEFKGKPIPKGSHSFIVGIKFGGGIDG